MQTKSHSIIILIKALPIRALVRDELKDIGLTDLVVCDDDEQATNALKSDPKAWFIYDGAHEPLQVARILKSAQAESPIMTRPIYLITADVSQDTLSIALEFYVAKVRSGEVNTGFIRSDLQILMNRVNHQSLIAEIMPDILKYKAAGRWDGALASLKVAQMADPTNEAITLELADTQIAAGELENALTLTENILAKSGANLRALHIKSRILMKQKKFSEAALILQEAEQNSGYHPGRLVDLGECLLNLERFKEAHQKFCKALEIDPTDQRAKSGQVKAVVLQGDLDTALELIRTFTSDEQIASTLNSAAVIAMRQNRSEDAMKMYQQCIKLLSKNQILSARVWFNYGIAHHKQHNLVKAITCFESASLLDPSFIHAAHNYHVVVKQLSKQGKGPAQDTKVQKPISAGEKLYDDVFYDDTGE